MRYGICTTAENAALLKELGYDYIELPLNKTASLTDEEFDNWKNLIKESGLKAETFSLLLPKTLSLFAPDFEMEMLDEYLDKAFSRMKELGGEVAVFGSGKSRVFPEDRPYGESFTRLVFLTEHIVKKASAYGVTIVIEPLNRAETNSVNTLHEGEILSSLSGASLLCDAFHLRRENESPEEILRSKRLTHAHIATLDGRRYPLSLDEEVLTFFAALKKSGYDGRLSIEGKTEDMKKDGALALEVLKTAYKEA
jgi:Sugar phosphate isomerases/epimerases